MIGNTNICFFVYMQIIMSVKSSTELMLYVCKNSDFKIKLYTLYYTSPMIHCDNRGFLVVT